MSRITHCRQTTENMLSCVRSGAGDPLDPPSPALLAAKRAFIAVLEAALASDVLSEHEEACQAAWAASLAQREEDCLARFGVPSRERVSGIHQGFADAAQKAVAAAEHLMAVPSVYGLAARTSAWTEAVDDWIAFVRREAPGVGDHPWDRFTACHNGFRKIAAAWHGGSIPMLNRVDPTRREGPTPMPSTVKQWWEIYHAATASLVRMQEAEARVRSAENDWSRAKTLASAPGRVPAQ